MLFCLLSLLHPVGTNHFHQSLSLFFSRVRQILLHFTENVTAVFQLIPSITAGNAQQPFVIIRLSFIFENVIVHIVQVKFASPFQSRRRCAQLLRMSQPTAHFISGCIHLCLIHFVTSFLQFIQLNLIIRR